MRASHTALAGSLITTEKRPTARQLDAVVTFIHAQGLTHSTLQCEGEPALVRLIEELGKQTSLPTSKSPACHQQLQEWQKNLFVQFRALLSDFCHRYKIQPCSVEISSSLGQHMLRHSVWLLNRFQLHERDNKTSFQRRWSTAYHISVLPFGELVLAQDQTLAIWFGRCEASDEHILAKANSSSLVKSRIVTRLSLEHFMDLILFKSITVPVPELASASYLKVAQLGNPPTAMAGGAKELRRVLPPRASTKQPQSKAKGRQPRASAASFHLPPGLTHPPLQPACPYELSDLAWQQPALHQQHALQQTALHNPDVQQQTSATTALFDQVIESPTRRSSLEEHASPQQTEKRSKTKKDSAETANELHRHRNLEKARTFQEIVHALNTSQDDLGESQAVVQQAQLRAYFEDDLSLFPAEELTKAKQEAGET